MKTIVFLAAPAGVALTGPALAEDVGVGVGVGPVGAGVTVGAGHDGYRDHDRTVIHDRREPRDKTVVIHPSRRRLNGDLRINFF
jgi:hypothetical protein